MNMRALNGFGIGATLPPGGLMAQATVDAANTLLTALQNSGCPVDGTIVTNFQNTYNADPNAGTTVAVTTVYDLATRAALADALGKLIVNQAGGSDSIDPSIPNVCTGVNATPLPALPASGSSAQATPAVATAGTTGSSTTLLIVGGIAVVAAVGALIYLQRGHGAASLVPSSASRRAPRRRSRRR
jgi:hypothetical protein